MGNTFCLTPYISPNFGPRELKIYKTLDLHGPHLHSEFCDPNPKNVAWGDDRIKKFKLFGRVPISHQNPAQGVKGTLNLRTTFYLGIKRKMRGRWGFLNFVPKIELGNLKFGGAKFILLPICPPILDSGSRKFLGP